MVMVLNILFFFSWIFILAYNGLVPDEYLEESVTSISRGILWGSITGVLAAFFILLPKYIKKEWDLHVVVPYFLTIHLVLSIIYIIGSLFILDKEVLFKYGLGFGFVIGGLIGIIAYMGEVHIEHKDKDNAEDIEILEENI